MKTFIKLLALVGIGAIVYWFVRERLAGEPDEFTFTEVTADASDAISETVGDSADAAAGRWCSTIWATSSGRRGASGAITSVAVPNCGRCAASSATP